MKKIILGFLIVVSLYTNAQPSIQWQKCLGGSVDEVSYSIQQTTDGGYILIGQTDSNNGDISGNHGGVMVFDVWVVKLSNLGVIQWQKCLGGSGEEYGASIQQTSDGGYILIGKAYSNDGDVFGNQGNNDTWVVKLSSLGVIQWQKCLGGSGIELGQSIQQTTDGGYILTGFTNSNNGDVSGNHGNFDIWVVKLSSLGVIQWQKCLGGSMNDIGYSIEQTLDGGYILTGYTASNDGDVSGNHGNKDTWVVKLSSLGVIELQKCLGGSVDDNGFSIEQTLDGGYILTGYTASNDGDVSGNHGNKDTWVVKLSSLGVIQWQKCLGGSMYENGYSIEQTLDGGYILTGFTASNDGDVSGNHLDGNQAIDAWVVKLSSTLGLEEPYLNDLVSLYPNPVTNVLNVKIDNNFENLNYRLIDVEGKIINQGLINENITSINVENLSKGFYFIKVSDNNVIKFIKD